ncbi:MAG: sugar phosphate isomerase/epimerase [Oscillospiraceae bacterium]|nr:sugar phosphate isomerase/epimerase [Oscillospiraceae bacterium]
MKLGFLTSILQDYDFEQVMDFAGRQGFQCVELACWPCGKAERRYAGVSHLDAAALDTEKEAYVKQVCREKKVEISSLAFYPNTLDPDLEKRSANIAHLRRLIDAAHRLGINMVSTFIGRDQNKTAEENLQIFAQVWPEIIAYAEQRKVRVAIENCPMLFGPDQWPGGQNLFFSPALWRRMFEIIPSDYFGINYDPSHFVWQFMDYIQPIYEFRDKIFHVHIKDIKLYPEKLNQVGALAYPLEFMSPKLPGLGDVNWSKYISALTDIGYNGCVCLEIEDRAFEGSEQTVLDSLVLSKRYIDQYVI